VPPLCFEKDFAFVTYPYNGWIFFRDGYFTFHKSIFFSSGVISLESNIASMLVRELLATNNFARRAVGCLYPGQLSLAIPPRVGNNMLRHDTRTTTATAGPDASE